jgi:hypothetical protein
MELQMRIANLLALMWLGLAASLGSAQALEQDFVKPKIGIFRLDWCRVWGAQCGKPAADQYCQSKGFSQSNNFEEAFDIGASTPTVVIGTGQQCADPSCDGFTFITCEKPNAGPPPPPPGPPPGPGGDTKTYKKPKIGGARLAYCYKKGKGCDGQTAADAYCEAKGWDDAADFNQSSPLTGLVPTRYIGNGKISKDPITFSFSDITCENN